MSATDEFENFRAVCIGSGRNLLLAGFDIAKEMGHTEVDPAHFVVASLRVPKEYSVSKYLGEMYGIDFLTAFAVIKGSLPVARRVSAPPIINEATRQMIRRVPECAYHRSSINRETPYYTAYDIVAASLFHETASGPVNLLLDGCVTYADLESISVGSSD